MVSQSFNANVVRFVFLAMGTMIAGAVGIPVLNYVNAPGALSTEAMILIKERMFFLRNRVHTDFDLIGTCGGSAILVSPVLPDWIGSFSLPSTIDCHCWSRRQNTTARLLQGK